MEKRYIPSAIESKWYQIWEKEIGFSCRDGGQQHPSYCIMLPPPNITGTLHMGHAFQHSLMDVLIRYKRMSGVDTLWQPGTDHAGIATQMLVERNLNKSGVSKHDLGRTKFIKKIWEWKQESGSGITSQMRRLGVSVDWEKEKFTMDDSLSAAVQKVFLDLYDKGLIYRGKKLVNWDPVLQTAVSDLEVITQEEKTHLWYIKYPLVDSREYLEVATTRPETLFGDVAVAVSPKDRRYASFIGKHLLCPINNRKIPIIADDYVDPEFGSGCVKITPAHDFNDYQIGQRHKLKQINIFTEDARLNSNVPDSYKGLDRFVARKKVIQELTKLGLLVKTLEYTSNIPRGDRSGAIIEPYLTWQWFIKMDSLAKPAIDAVRSGKIQFIPKQWENTYFNWLENIQDWCISRQLWWGHRIPVWYDDDGNYYVGKSLKEIRVKYSLPQDVSLTQDDDVLDTWFSSSLWTFTTLGWPDKTSLLEKFHPTSVLVTGFDIIFFWVARMIMMSLECTGEIPFKQVYITGLVRDSLGNKMSKSKGNVLDPIDIIDGITLDKLIEKRSRNLLNDNVINNIVEDTKRSYPQGIASYGTDALRFTFCALASTGRDIRFDIGRIDGYSKFCNKLYNASRFVLLTADKVKPISSNTAVTDIEKWITGQLNDTIYSYTQAIERFRFDLAANIVYEFVWHKYCDWYIELVKSNLALESLSQENKQAIVYTLVEVLEKTLRLLHPIMPFITEEIWQAVAPIISANKVNSIMLANFPLCTQPEQECGSLAVDRLQQIVATIRNMRSQNSINPQHKLSVVLVSNNLIQDKSELEKYNHHICVLAKIECIVWQKDIEQENYISHTLGSLSINISKDALNVDSSLEKDRLKNLIRRGENKLIKLDKKLSNPLFISKAPANIVKQVEKERDTLFASVNQYKKHLLP